MSPRAGRSTLGCLVGLLVVAVVVYFGSRVGEVFYRYFMFRDAMRQQARFAARNDDAVIRERLAATADSLGLPEGAGHVQIRREPHHIYLWAEYYEQVELPLAVRELYFNPQAEGNF